MHIYIYIYTYVCIYIYIYIYTHVYIINRNRARTPYAQSTKGFPTKSPRVKLSGRLPIKSYGHGNSHPLESRVCLSQTL